MARAIPAAAIPGTVRAAAARQAAAVGQMKVKFDPLRLALFLLIVISVSRIHQHYRFIAVMHPAQLMVALTGLYAFLNPRTIEHGLFRTWPPRVVAALGAFALFGAPFGISLGASGYFILTEYSKTIVLCFLLVLGIRNARDLYAFVWAYVISTGILVWMALFVFGLSRATGSATARLSNLYMFDANDLGLVLMVGLALTILAYQTTKGWRKLACILIMIGIGAAIARSGSRGAFVGLVITGLFLLAMLKAVPVAKRLAFLFVIVLALAVTAPPGYWTQMATIVNPTEDYNWTSKDGRRQVTKRGLGYMFHNPLFGLGIGNFERAECMLSIKADQHIAGTGLRCTPPHNSYIEAGAELGIPGLILWCSLVFGGIIGMVRLRRRLPRHWIRGDPEQQFLYRSSTFLAVAMVGFASTALFLSFAWIDIVYILAALMAGLYVSVRKKLAQERGGAAPVPVRSGRMPHRMAPARGRLRPGFPPR